MNRFLSVVNGILNKSRRLAVFNSDPALSSTKLAPMTQSHPLQERAHWRRLIYERPGKLNKELTPVPDIRYWGRNVPGATERSLNAREVATLLHENPRVINTPDCLEGILETWPVIRGLKYVIFPSSLEKCLNTDIREYWGPLVQFCRIYPPEDVYRIMFFMSLVAFYSDADMRMIRVFISFFLFEELRTLDYPLCPSFVGFRSDEQLDAGALAAVVRPCCQSYDDNPLQMMNRNDSEALRMVELQRDDHNRLCDDITDDFVQFIIDQWPCRSPVVDGFSEALLDRSKALEAVLLEWHRIFYNTELHYYLEGVQRILDEHYTDETGVPEPTHKPEAHLFGHLKANTCPVPHLGHELVRKEYKFGLHNRPSKRALSLSFQLDGLCADMNHLTVSYKQRTPEIDELEAVVDSLAESKSSVRSLYSQDLKKSIMALRTLRPSPKTGVRVR